MIGGFFNIVYYITVLEVPDRHSAYILSPLEYTHQYLYLYYLVIIIYYLTGESSEIGC
jgi:hypothetical protein